MSSPTVDLPARPIRLYDSWWTVTAAGLGALIALTVGLWVSVHVKTDTELHTAALFAHLASLVVGFGAVLSADYYGLLWAMRRCALAEVVSATSRLHIPIWAGLGGLVVSGLMLHPDLDSPLTLVKLGLVGLLTLNGLQAGLLGHRLSTAPAITPRLLAWAAATAVISQLCWWGAVTIGFLNTNS
ncbi:hypothetical protein J7E97_13230 [Streptomyces sp. ISL-66]|uniref:hypothetical protein n=1 Tax=Streptomyces sp. ISL-66 TaxID=2819186 RepID=UPI001BE69F50|nr:hypothetical protein [Streptomyces sp. ISL-66]MBT2468810.1 hypothetical protein [Streptomyces sp. ISL-66]